MFDVADRLEIINAINLNSHYYDEERYDDWLDLFTADATLELPWGDVLNGREEIQQIVDANNQSLATYKAGGGKTRQFRHLFTNIAVTNQSESQAEVLAYALFTVIYDGEEMIVPSTLTYSGRLVKVNNAWLISDWVLKLDGTLPDLEARAQLSDTV